MKKWGARLRSEGFLRDPSYSDAFDLIDRKDFLPDNMKGYADADEPIPIPFDQTQSAPHMDAIFVDSGEPRKSENLLEIGTGSGYLTAILSLLSKSVVSLECISVLSHFARENISRYDVKNVELIVGNVNHMCLKTRFDLIISTASFRKEPYFLRDLLNHGGRAIFPIGSYPPQRLVRYKNEKREELGSVAFVNIVD